jgi:Tfp pilus assembly protein PilV
MKHNPFKNKKRGMGLVEVIVGVAIITTGILSLVGAYFYYLQVMVHNTPNIQAAYLLEESIETTRLLRDQSWNGNIATLSPAIEYHLIFSPATSKWSTTSGTSPLIDGQFDRVITASSTYRNANHDIVPVGTPGSILDASTTLITAKVSWLENNGTTSKTLSAYLTNIFRN